jgi:hypothetical protein
MADTLVKLDDEQQRRRRVRRTALLLGLIALSFYGGFILMGVLRA